jgi:aryl carrier-like protein
MDEQRKGLELERMRADVAEVLYVDAAEVEDDANLLDLGIDSIRLMTLAQRWTEAAGTRVAFADLAMRPELRHWWRLAGNDPLGTGS